MYAILIFMPPLISIIIPVFNTPEHKLRRCLKSALAQTVPDGDKSHIEIIIVDDCSIPPCKNLIADLAADNRVRIFRHLRNKGCFESRRTGVKKAHVEYLVNLDSDDELTFGDSCTRFYAAAKNENADIVQCFAKNVFEGELPSGELQAKKRGIPAFQGKLYGSDIFDSFFAKMEQTTFLWGKCIRRELFIRALKKIPRVYCTQNEDMLLYFFIALCAQSYVTLPEELYTYYAGEGTSTARRIHSLVHWRSICSSAKAFGIIQKYLFVHVELEKYLPQLPAIERLFLFMSLHRYHAAVDGEIREEAWRMLCNAWGTRRVYEYNRQFEREAQEQREARTLQSQMTID